MPQDNIDYKNRPDTWKQAARGELSSGEYEEFLDSLGMREYVDFERDRENRLGEKSSLESQIAAAVTKSGSKQETKQVSIKQASGEASGISDSASVKAGQTSAPTQGKAADLAAASFEQISQSIDAKESVSQGVHR